LKRDKHRTSLSDQISNIPEKEQIRFALVYIAQMLENIHKDIVDLTQHLEDGVTVFTEEGAE